jgi:signal transduction histidine kinase
MNKGIRKSAKITTLIILFPLVTLLLYGGLSHLFFFYAKQSDAKHELERYEKMLMDAEKTNLIEKVQNLTRFIRYYNYKSSDKIKKEVLSIIYASANIANNIYYKYRNTMDEKALKQLIMHALERVDFEGDIGYLFLQDMQGNAYVHPDKSIVGSNTLNIRDVNGKYIVKEFMGVLEEKGEGFVDYYWYIPNKNKKNMYYKITFVKKLAMYDWYIGAGEYLKYMTQFVSQEMLDYIKENAYFKYGHFFISNSKNEIIFHPEPDHIAELSKFRMEGVYEDDQRIAYTAYVAEYDWYITAVKELQGIRKNINFRKQENEKKIEEDIQTNLYLMVTTWLISLLFSLYLSSIVNRMLKRYEERLNESNNKLIFQSRQALIGELFSMIAHQWRQPINKIASILALLRFNTANDKPDYRALDQKFQEIEESVEFMSDTIDDFRTFYQPKEASEKIDLKVLINKSIDFLSGSIHKKDIRITKKLEDISCRMYGNEFLQVMINLIKNATDAVSQRGEIHVKMYRKDGEIIVTVEDNGIGIDPESLSRIFDPYFSTKIDSMGLGLYMSRMIIERHLEGTIDVSSLEKGVKFTLTFADYRQS